MGVRNQKAAECLIGLNVFAFLNIYLNVCFLIRSRGSAVKLLSMLSNVQILVNYHLA